MSGAPRLPSRRAATDATQLIVLIAAAALVAPGARDRLRWAAVVMHGLTLVLVMLSVLTSDLARGSVLAAPCALAVVLLQAALVARALGRGPPRALAVVVAIAALVSLAAIAVWGIPHALVAIGWLLDPIAGQLVGTFADLLGLGLVLAVLPVAIAIVVAMSARRELRVLALITAALVAAAVVAKALLLGGGALSAWADESYWTVGVSHALVVLPLVACVAWALLPRRPTRGLVALTALGLVLLGCACVAEIALDQHGMARRYATYDEAFTTGHLLVSAAWALVLAHLALWLGFVARARRREIPIEDLA